MVDLVHANAYCVEDISLIENYDKAIADKENTWHCHHKLEGKKGIYSEETRRKMSEAHKGLKYKKREKNG